MTKKVRSLLITLILLAVIVGAMAVLRLRNDIEDVPAATEPGAIEILTDYNIPELRSIEIENKSGVLQFVSEDGKSWLLADTPRFYQLQTEKVVTVVRTLSRLQTREIIAENAGENELAEFGLDRPEAKIRFKDRGGDISEVDIGVSNPGATGRFARVAGSGTVVLLPVYAADHALSSLADFRDMRLPEIDIENLVALEYRYGENAFRMEPRTGEDPFVTMVSPYVVTSPWRGTYPLDDYEFQTVTTDDTPFPARIKEFLDDTDSEDPALGIDVDGSDFLYMSDLSGNTLHLIIGSSDGQGNRYVRYGDREGPSFLLSEHDLAFIETDPFRLISKFVFLGSIIQISQVKVEKARDIWIMERIERGDPEDIKDDRFVINQLEVADKEFTSVYQKFISLMWEGIAVEDVDLGSPEIRITVRNVGAGIDPMILRFWNYDEVYFQVSLNDGPLEFLVGRYQIDDFLEDLAALSEYGS